MSKFDRDRIADPLSYFELEGSTPQRKVKWRTTDCKLHGGSNAIDGNSAGLGKTPWTHTVPLVETTAAVSSCFCALRGICLDLTLLAKQMVAYLISRAA